MNSEALTLTDGFGNPVELSRAGIRRAMCVSDRVSLNDLYPFERWDNEYLRAYVVPSLNLVSDKPVYFPLDRIDDAVAHFWKVVQAVARSFGVRLGDMAECESN